MNHNCETHEHDDIVKQKNIIMYRKFTNPELVKMVSEDNPFYDIVYDMLLWGSDDTYLTRESAGYLRELHTLLSALELGKPFEDRIVSEES